ncbi:GPI-anchored surface protein, putative, partial [Bodo saltans]
TSERKKMLALRCQKDGRVRALRRPRFTALQLRHLSLSGKRSVGAHDETAALRIVTFVHLRSVTLIHWEVSSTLMRALGQLPELEHVNLKEGKSRKWIDVQPLLLLRWEYLRSLQLPAMMSHANALRSSFPSLQLLSLVGAHIIPSQFKSLASLRSLSLEDCWWHRSNSSELFGTLHHLRRLALHSCSLNDEDLLEISSHLTNLFHLTLDIPALSRNATDSGLLLLSSLVNLEHLYLKCGPQRRMFFGDREEITLTDVALEFLGALSRLRYLSLSFPYISHDGMQRILRMQHLTELHLHCRGMNELFLFRLVELRLLKVLSLGRCRHVTDRVLARWTRLQCLEEVTLSECYGSFTDDGLDCLRTVGGVAVSPERIGKRSSMGKLRLLMICNCYGLSSGGGGFELVCS